MKKFFVFLLRIIGIVSLFEYVRGIVFAYKLSLRMIPVSYKLFVWGLGVLFGSSFVFLAYEVPKYTEPSIITIVNAKPATTQNIASGEVIESVEDTIRRVAKEKDFPEVETLVKIAFCESSFDRLAENKESSAKGVFQILDMHGLTAVERFNVEKSTIWAIERATVRGFKDWNASKNCWNKK